MSVNKINSWHWSHSDSCIFQYVSLRRSVPENQAIWRVQFVCSVMNGAPNKVSNILLRGWIIKFHGHFEKWDGLLSLTTWFSRTLPLLSESSGQVFTSLCTEIALHQLEQWCLVRISKTVPSLFPNVCLIVWPLNHRFYVQTSAKNLDKTGVHVLISMNDPHLWNILISYNLYNSHDWKHFRKDNRRLSEIFVQDTSLILISRVSHQSCLETQ